MTEEIVRQREEIAMQITALNGHEGDGCRHGFDISACQRQGGCPVALLRLSGRHQDPERRCYVGWPLSTFLDIYIQRDHNGTLTESEAQGSIDHMVMKFRMVKFARIPSYNQLFSGDPSGRPSGRRYRHDGRSMVTKNDFRFLHTLENMGPAPSRT